MEEINQVELTLRIGRFGERVETVVVPIGALLAHQLTEPVELSHEPFSLLLASPAVWGGRGDAVTIRQKKFALRRDMARSLSKQIEDKLMELFGAEDRTDGYRKQAGLSPRG